MICAKKGTERPTNEPTTETLPMPFAPPGYPHGRIFQMRLAGYGVFGGTVRRQSP